MKPASRIEATIDILSKGHLARVPLDSTVGDYMRVRRYIGAKDRSEIAERVYNVTRAHARLGWWLEKNSSENTPRNRVIAWLVLGEGCGMKRLGELFDGSQYAPDELTEAEHALIAALEGKTLDEPEMSEAVRGECPPDFEVRLRELFGDRFLPEMQAMLQPATLDLRVNLFLAEKDLESQVFA